LQRLSRALNYTTSCPIHPALDGLYVIETVSPTPSTCTTRRRRPHRLQTPVAFAGPTGTGEGERYLPEQPCNRATAASAWGRCGVSSPPSTVQRCNGRRRRAPASPERGRRPLKSEQQRIAHRGHLSLQTAPTAPTAQTARGSIGAPLPTNVTKPNPHRKIPKSRPLLTPNPLRHSVYDPLQDDEVKVNIRPLQEAGLLRLGKVV
jgi:hypothetical protein